VQLIALADPPYDAEVPTSRHDAEVATLRHADDDFAEVSARSYESEEDSSSHAPDSHASSPLGIPSGIQMSDAIH
jgi:hypothetical protein